MKLLKCLMLFALIPLFYSCSENLMNDEDPASALKAEQATEQNPSTEFIKSEHIAGYLDAQAGVLYIMPEVEEIALHRLGVAKLGENRYEISKSHAEGAVTRVQFNVVKVKERAMIYKLASVRGLDEETISYGGEDPIGEPIEFEDYIIYNLAKCKQVWGQQVSPCTPVGVNSSIKVWRWTYSTCQTGEDICIETKQIVRTTGTFEGVSCEGTPTYTYLRRMSCATGL